MIRAMKQRSNAWLHAGWLAGVVFGLALAWAGAQLEGYDHGRHSVGVLGSTRSPVAGAFNAVGYELPGVLLAVFAASLRARLRDAGAGFGARLGADLMLVSGLAFAAQGLLPIDLSDGDGPASQRHVMALMLALIAMLASMAVLGAGLRHVAAWRPLPQAGMALAALLLLSLAWPAHAWLPGWEGRSGFSLRLSLLAYFAWPAWVAWVALRRQRPA